MTTAGWSGRNERTISQEAIKQGPEMLQQDWMQERSLWACAQGGKENVPEGNNMEDGYIYIAAFSTMSQGARRKRLERV